MNLYVVLISTLVVFNVPCLLSFHRSKSHDYMRTLNETNVPIEAIKYILSFTRFDLDGYDDDAILEGFREEEEKLGVFEVRGNLLKWLSFYGKIDHIIPVLDSCRKLGLADGFMLLFTNGDGYTALHAAAQEGHLEVVELLLSLGACAMSRACDGSTPLHLAAQNGHAKVVARLLRCEDMFMNPDRLGRYPIHLAAWKGHEDVCMLLVSAGAVINRQAHSGITPLLAAAYQGHKDVVKELLRLKADPTIKNTAGESPADCARNVGCSDLAEMLEGHVSQVARQRTRRGSP